MGMVSRIINEAFRARQQAIDETKKGGDGQKAIALAIVYLADTMREVQ